MNMRDRSWANRAVVAAIGLVVFHFSVSQVVASDCADSPKEKPPTFEEAAARQAERQALKTAAANGDVAELGRLVGAGACIRTADWSGPSPLILAVTHNHLATVKWLVRVGADLEARDRFVQEQTALMWAAADDSHDILLELVAAGADLNARDANGWTALVWSAVRGNPRALDDLAAGADPAVGDEMGWTAIMHAKYYGHANLVDRLRALGAPGDTRIVDLIHAIRRNDITTVSAQLASGVNPNARAPYGFTLLQLASDGHPEIVRELISAGVDVNAIGATGYTALMSAANGRNDRSDPDTAAYVEVASLLIQAGTDVNFAVRDAGSQQGQTALHRAAHSGIVGIAERLLDNGAAIEARSAYLRSTPLMWAAHSLNADMVAFLLKRGADPLAVDDRGWTAADVARDACHFWGDMNGVSDEQRRQTCQRSEDLATLITEYGRRAKAP